MSTGFGHESSGGHVRYVEDVASDGAAKAAGLVEADISGLIQYPPEILAARIRDPILPDRSRKYVFPGSAYAVHPAIRPLKSPLGSECGME
jgi:hypothetical protein